MNAKINCFLSSGNGAVAISVQACQYFNPCNNGDNGCGQCHLRTYSYLPHRYRVRLLRQKAKQNKQLGKRAVELINAD